MGNVENSVLRWTSRRKRTYSEAVSRWGHYLAEAVEDGLIEIGEPQQVELGGYRDMQRRVQLTDAGRARLRPTHDRR